VLFTVVLEEEDIVLKVLRLLLLAKVIAIALPFVLMMIMRSLLAASTRLDRLHSLVHLLSHAVETSVIVIVFRIYLKAGNHEVCLLMIILYYFY